MHLQKNKMRIFIDADGCPVTESAINFAKQHNIECYVVCDTSHEFSFNYASVITVSKGKDSADYKIVNLISPGDIVVTQDYGLAAMCLAKNARAINQNGLIYTDNNIDFLCSQGIFLVKFVCLAVERKDRINEKIFKMKIF